MKLYGVYVHNYDRSYVGEELWHTAEEAAKYAKVLCARDKDNNIVNYEVTEFDVKGSKA